MEIFEHALVEYILISFFGGVALSSLTDHIVNIRENKNVNTFRYHRPS